MDWYVRSLALYSSQILVLVIVAASSATMIRGASGRVRLAFWRLLLAVCLLLPLAPPQVLEADVASAGAVLSMIPVDPPGRAAADSTFSASAFAIAVMATGVLVRALWLVAGFIRLRALRRQGEPADLRDDLLDLHRSLAAGADVRWHDQIPQPVTFGYLRPVVLLPARLAGMPPDVQRAVLCHELLHVDRGDWLSAVLEELVRTVFWFHPAVWWVINRIQVCREEAVDALAVSMTASKRAYMQALLAFGDSSPWPVAPAPRFVRRRHLVARIKQISQEDVMSHTRLAVSAAGLFVIVATCGWTVASALPLRTEVRASSPGGSMSSAIQAVKAPSPPPSTQAPPSDDKSNPRVLVDRKPAYPSEALPHGAGASVWVAIKIDSAGRVAEAKATKWQLTIENSIDDPNYWASKPERSFIDAAEAAALQWTFAPLDANTKTSVELLFTFRNVRGGSPAVAAKQDDARALRVGGAVLPPKKIADVKPLYPEDALAQGVEGIVVIEVRIGTDGAVKDARVVRSIPMLDAAAVQAVRGWRFVPTLMNGEPIDVIMNVTINFVAGR